MNRDPNLAENVRLAIAAQPSIEQGIAAFFRTVSTHIHDAVESEDLGQLKALADHIDRDPRAWSDALLANTPAAPQTIAPSVPQMPVYVQEAFRDHGTLQHDAAQHEEARNEEAEQADRQSRYQYPAAQQVGGQREA